MVPFDFLPTNLSPSQQFIINVGLFFGVVIGVAINFLRGKTKPPGIPRPAGDDMIIQAASIADMRPMREAGRHISELVEVHRAMLAHVDHAGQTLNEIREEMRALREIAANMAKETEMANRMRERGQSAR